MKAVVSSRSVVRKWKCEPRIDISATSGNLFPQVRKVPPNLNHKYASGASEGNSRNTTEQGYQPCSQSNLSITSPDHMKTSETETEIFYQGQFLGKIVVFSSPSGLSLMAKRWLMPLWHHTAAAHSATRKVHVGRVFPCCFTTPCHNLPQSQ